MHRVLIIFAGAAMGFTSMATAIGFIIDAPHLFLLQRHHAETVGRLAQFISNGHGSVAIEYAVGGTSYK
jgi:hypothetical protein